ncbi:hypothetical protein FGK63_01100 [Ruegeria sediminis]|uniref:DUF1835 domain-containing protein n=1 Tax=Ruegeria sediminis TaxID=2583820 RepID=A0ABY2X2S9_9RHOB|nr:hypothetical protein [Ruegeria sediminis]TMV09696.1 hypothetical protein FGK63_01100 [Ruegeria sediminis]
MQVALHAGAHLTDEGRLLNCLADNKGTFKERGIEIPEPEIYRGLLRETFERLASQPPAPGLRDDLVEAILDGETAERVVLSNVHFFGPKWTCIGEETFYPLAGPRMAQLCDIFVNDQVELFMALQNPGVFIPKILNALPEPRRLNIMQQTSLGDLRWSTMIEQIQQMAPDAKLTFWCNEDTPLIWGQILRALGGLSANDPIRGLYALLGELLTEDGRQEFRVLLSRNPNLDQRGIQNMIADVLQRHARDEMMEEELDLPGWNSDVVDAFTELYDEDVASIRAMPGITFLAPG